MAKQSAGQLFRDAVANEKPLQVVGAINANHALLAKRAGFQAIYLSGGGVAAGSQLQAAVHHGCGARRGRRRAGRGSAGAARGRSGR